MHRRALYQFDDAKNHPTNPVQPPSPNMPIPSPKHFLYQEQHHPHPRRRQTKYQTARSLNTKHKQSAQRDHRHLKLSHPPNRNRQKVYLQPIPLFWPRRQRLRHPTPHRRSLFSNQDLNTSRKQHPPNVSPAHPQPPRPCTSRTLRLTQQRHYHVPNKHQQQGRAKQWHNLPINLNRVRQDR